MRLTSAAAAVATAGTVVVLGAAPAFAAAPSNDTISGAVAVTIGYSQTLDTTQATTDADDAQVNGSCGAPATDASVWYTYTAAADGGVIVDVSASDYSAGLIVATGSPGALDTLACGPGTVAFGASNGQTYYILAFDDQTDGSGNGGSLNISVEAAPPPPVIDVTINPTGVAHKDGTATISGSYTCTNGDFVDVFGEVSQAVGRVATVNGFFEVFDGNTCDGTAHTWAALAVPDSGKFAGGKAVTVTFADACGLFECAEAYATQTVRLRRGHG